MTSDLTFIMFPYHPQPVVIRTATLVIAVNLATLIDAYCMVYTPIPHSRMSGSKWILSLSSLSVINVWYCHCPYSILPVHPYITAHLSTWPSHIYCLTIPSLPSGYSVLQSVTYVGLIRTLHILYLQLVGSPTPPQLGCEFSPPLFSESLYQ